MTIGKVVEFAMESRIPVIERKLMRCNRLRASLRPKIKHTSSSNAFRLVA
jgi:hypothetical protein